MVDGSTMIRAVEDQLRVTVEPLGVFSVFEEKSAKIGKLNTKTIHNKALFIPYPV